MKDYREFAIWLAKEAGKLIMKSYGKSHSLDWNTLTHFKTEVDDASDALIRQRIKRTYPEHNIYSEEGKGLDKGSKYSWVCDSLDGTIPYALGITAHFSVSIALVKERTPIVGVVNAAYNYRSPFSLLGFKIYDTNRLWKRQMIYLNSRQ